MNTSPLMVKEDLVFLEKIIKNLSFSREIRVYRYLASYKKYLNARTTYVLRMQKQGCGD
jgi:hypothetical protein